jgi:lipopolysaccharide export system protein LptC
MVQIRDELFWNADSVALLMLQNRIPTRAALASALGVARSTVNSTLDEHWGGTATTRMIARMATHFGVTLSTLVTEPVVMLNKINGRARNKQDHQIPNKAGAQ